MDLMIQRKAVQFWFGLCLGLVVGFIGSNLNVRYPSVSSSILMRKIESPLDRIRPVDSHLAHELLDREVNESPVQSINFEDTGFHQDDDSIAKDLVHKVRVLCWVMTAPKNLDKKARAVKDTWGKRCNKLLFFSSVNDTSFPTIGLNTSEGREHLTAKTMLAFRYVYENHFHDADWFLKADDDTYVIVENLRYFLSQEDTNAPFYFGHHFKPLVQQGYFSGGAGYVVGREGLRRFYKLGNATLCRQDGGSEDVEFGKCMQNLGVKTMNTTDAMGRTRFHCLSPTTHVTGEYPKWYYSFDSLGPKKGVDSISDYAISFHYVNPESMYGLEFYVYHLRPHGIFFGLQNLNKVHNTTHNG